jgi:hypothetical protein
MRVCRGGAARLKGASRRGGCVVDGRGEERQQRRQRKRGEAAI